jgi:hypothetical protein
MAKKEHQNNRSKFELQSLIIEAQTNVSWAEHKRQHDERRIWNHRLRELQTELMNLRPGR